MLQPRVGFDGGLAPVAIVVQELLPSRDVSGGDEDEVRHAIDVMQFGLAIPTLTVVDESPQAVRFSSGIHTAVMGRTRITSIDRLLTGWGLAPYGPGGDVDWQPHWRKAA